MTKFKGKTYILFVLDKSGSMDSQRDRAISGYNEFLGDQKKIKDDKASITLTLFDTIVDNLYADKDLDEAKELTRGTYKPSGWTALYDAIGISVKAVEKKVTDKDRVVVTIFTDGQENSSREYNHETIRKLITEKEGEGNWTFAFMGVDKDAWVVGQRIGINDGNTFSIDPNDLKMSTRYASANLLSYRSTNATQTKAFYQPTKGEK